MSDGAADRKRDQALAVVTAFLALFSIVGFALYGLPRFYPFFVEDLGWTRQQVVDYLRTSTAMNEVEVQQETDRYIELPGQGLSYLCGRFEIDRIRRKAQAGLGPEFELRAFHDVVLGTGPLPMDVLDEVVTDWMGDA